MSQWFVIDQNGRRPVSSNPRDFWDKFSYDRDDEWPEFAQLVLDAQLDHVELALRTWSKTAGLSVTDVTDSVDAWEGSIWIVENGKALCLCEPGVELEDRLIHPESAELIVGLLSCGAGFFGADPATSTVFVNTYDLGQIEVSWVDSESPGPSFARVFHRHGSCTEEDPRSFALNRLNMPATSPLLDRYAFIETMLAPLRLKEFSPEVKSDTVVRVLRLRPIG